MPIDNFDLIRGFLKFDGHGDDFYYLQILQRKKEHPELGSNSRVVRNYYITSLEHLEKRHEEIVSLCQTFNARAMLRLNRRSFEKTALKAMVNLANSIANKDHAFSNKAYDRAAGQGHIEKPARWILDIDGVDTGDTPFWTDLELFIRNAMPHVDNDEEMPIGTKKILGSVPSKNGVHVICTPFNLAGFSEKFPQIEIHKDNPTNLYIP